MHYLAWICLLLACAGTGWFVYQYFLVPQQKYFNPDWHGAQWIRATDGNLATAYFHDGVELQAVPDNAFVTIAASQVFRLYVNGTLIGSSSKDFGNYPRAYMYEITPSLALGANTFAIRVDNLDSQIPLLRATITVITDDVVSNYGTGIGWQATTQASLVYPQNTMISQALTAWTGQRFDTSPWPSVLPLSQSPIAPSLTVNPLLYEHPAATQWITGGVGQDAYFVQQVSLPDDYASSWLRVASTGTTDIFINGNLVVSLNYQLERLKQVVIDKATGTTSTKDENELPLGAYDVSPYLHPGINTIAVHVSLHTINGFASNQDSTNAELALDMLIGDTQGHTIWLTSTAGWKVSNVAVVGWTTDSNAVSAWSAPVGIGHPDGYAFIYLSENNLLTSKQQTSQIIPTLLLLQVILFSIAGVLGCWLLMSLVLMRRCFHSYRDALEAMTLAYLPALALEGLLIVLSGEPLIPQPFPYTGFWLIILAVLVGAGYLLLWLHAHKGAAYRFRTQTSIPGIQSLLSPVRQAKGSRSNLPSRFLAWLRAHWPIIPLVLLTLPLAFYNLGYEDYWQDELASYNVARSIMRNGLPLLPSGFVYAKGELYSYLLALAMKIFGDQAGVARMLSSAEYLLTLLLLYHVGCYFFDRRVALLATMMLALSYHELVWARQVRMYQQAQLLTLLSVYLFYRAVAERDRVSLIYLAAGSLILTYLSHEETFIILPALLICVVLISFVTRDAHHSLPAVLYQKHWWFAVTITVAVIGLQQVIAHVTHPPVLGTDVSLQPEVQFTTDNVRYYFDLLFLSTANEPANNPLISNIPRAITMSSVLMVLGCFWARKENSLRVKYIALLFVISLLTLIFIFTMQADRYFYPLFTFYYLIAAFAMMKILRAIWTFALTRRLRQRSVESPSPITNITSHSLPVRVMVVLTATMAFLSMLIVPILPLSSYNLFISRALGLPYYRHFGDYSKTEQFLLQHMRKDDIVISIIPDSIVLYYVGQSDYFFSINHDLFLYEHDGQIVDTYTGNSALLNQSDFNAVLASHDRIWLISADNYYQKDVLRRFSFPLDFHVAYVGSNSIIYLRGG